MSTLLPRAVPLGLGARGKGPFWLRAALWCVFVVLPALLRDGTEVCYLA